MSVPSSLVLDEMEKQSTCELEVDAVAADILNRLEIQSKTTLDNILRQWIGCGLSSCIHTTFTLVIHQQLMQLTEKIHAIC